MGFIKQKKKERKKKRKIERKEKNTVSYTFGVFLVNETNIQATCSSSLLTGTAKTKGFDLAHVRLLTMNGDIADINAKK